jgi:hypothetical protein
MSAIDGLLQPHRTRMKKPIPDKAEVAIEYPDKLYMGTFERSSRFEAHLDENGISLTLERRGDLSTKKSVHLHLHYGLFAEILHELARTTKALPLEDEAHRASLAEAAAALHDALGVKGA